ncbi:uncharacterized protein TNCV_3936341 [Trichonephila clavipes]|nr:uncharacterized protein TNCV_3936341 [Trichonephila clavipes]
MNSTPSIVNAASVVAQSKKDHVPGLGRGPGLINNLRSPNSLKIIQFNINGISTSATRIKLDQVLELALTEGAQIIPLQETQLKTITSLKIKGYNIFSYNTKEALDISIASSDDGPSCKWTLLENLGSDHRPILIELKKRQLVPTNNNKQRIFKKADGQSFAEVVVNGIKSIPLKDSVDLNWCSFKEMILRAAKKYIPRGKLKNRKPYLSSKSPLLQPPLEESVRIELNKTNAKIKRLYVQIKKVKWNYLCSGLDSRTSNEKLWKLLKNISNELPQAEKKCDTILSEDGNLAVNDEQAADLLGLYYQKISRLNFSVEGRNIKIRASRSVHGCRSDTHRGSSIFNRDFRVN